MYCCSEASLRSFQPRLVPTAQTQSAKIQQLSRRTCLYCFNSSSGTSASSASSTTSTCLLLNVIKRVSAHQHMHVPSLAASDVVDKRSKRHRFVGIRNAAQHVKHESSSRCNVRALARSVDACTTIRLLHTACHRRTHHNNNINTYQHIMIHANASRRVDHPTGAKRDVAIRSLHFHDVKVVRDEGVVICTRTIMSACSHHNTHDAEALSHARASRQPSAASCGDRGA
jgi:hypothetical protein